MNDKIWTIGRILKWTEQYFRDKGIESPRLDAEVLLAHVLEKQRIYLYVHFDEPLQPAELAAYREMIKQRVLRVPVAQILGEKEFMGLTFKVTADTLVPRPDTEILVQAAVERLKAMKGEAKTPEDEALADGEEASSAANRDEAAVDVSQEPLRIADIGITEEQFFETMDRIPQMSDIRHYPYAVTKEMLMKAYETIEQLPV